MKSILFLLIIFSTAFCESSEDKKKRECVDFIIQDQRLVLNVIEYHSKIIRMYVTDLISNSTRIPPDSINILVDKVSNEFKRELYNYENGYKKLIEDTYMNYYSLKELNKLKDFYSSPLGAKLWQAQSDINLTIYKNADDVIKNILRNVWFKLDPFLKQKELEDTVSHNEKEL